MKEEQVMLLKVVISQWPAPGLGTDRRRICSVLMRWRAMSFSSTTVECPFLLGVEVGTVPLGRELKNKDGSTLFLLCFCAPRWSFLASRHEQREAKRTKNRTRWEPKRAMESGNWNKGERVRRREEMESVGCLRGNE